MRLFSFHRLGKYWRCGLVRVVAVVLGVAMLGNSVALAAGPVDHAAKFQKKVAERGIGKAIKVKQADGTNLTGVITAIHDDTFEITLRDTTQPLVIPYAQVASLHSTGMPKAAKIGIWVAVGLVATAIVGAIVIAEELKNDPI